MLRTSLFLALCAAPALSQTPQVLADLPVAQSLAAQVMGDLGAPGLLLDRGADPHSVQLRPSQARALAGAGLVIWTGPGMSPWLQAPLGTLASGAVLDLAGVDGVYQQGFAPSVLLDGAGDDDHADHAGHDDHDDHADHDDHEGHDHAAHDAHAGHAAHGDHADHADHDDHEGHEGHDHATHDDHDDHAHDSHDHDHDHAHGAIDPHLWLHPDNAVIWLRAIAAELATLDPANAAQYSANAEAAVAQTLALQAELAEILAPVGDAGLVVFHDAYGYLATAYGLNLLGSITEGDAAAPGAARLSALRAALDGAGAVCLFPEVNHPVDFARVVAEGTDLRLGAPLDPAGVMLEPGPALYGNLMRGLARSIAECVTPG